MHFSKKNENRSAEVQKLGAVGEQVVMGKFGAWQSET